MKGAKFANESATPRSRIAISPAPASCEYVTYCAQLCDLPFKPPASAPTNARFPSRQQGQERYRNIDTYSTGMRQRLKLAQSIVHDPEIVFLDEPTNGLDPKGQAQILELVQSLWRTHGITVVLSSHMLQDVEQICEQIVIIARGRVLGHDSLANLKARTARILRQKWSCPSVTPNCRPPAARRQWPCQMLPNGHIKVEHKSQSLNSLLTLLDELKLPPLEIIPSPNALEETFVQALEISHAAT